MNLEMVGELSEKNILMCKVPLVEGAYTAASLLQAGVPFEAVIEQLREMYIDK
ncbi:phosphotransferase mannnose-specific family component IIA [Streptococcus infantarius subsp. infantarius]|nr:phosphotransferase mannnose-specific family component IIA [Streptococcus infantarius subsp. infantarius]